MTHFPEDDWKRKRDKHAVRQAAERLKRMERERLRELWQRLDEMGGEPDTEPPPRID